MTEATGLRAHKKRQTRAAIARAALELAAQRPYADITVAQIAEAAGVSRRTISNYYSSKADCFAGVIGGRILGDMIAELLPMQDGDARQRLARAFTLVDLSYWNDLSLLHSLARSEPDVAAAVAYAQQSQIDEITDALVAASCNELDPLRLRITIATIGACISVATEYWLNGGAQGGPAALAALVASSFDHLDLHWLDAHLDILPALHASLNT